MAEESTQQYLRSIDVNQKIVASIDNGIIILDDKLQIQYFNKWLEIHTSIKEIDVIGKEIHSVFPITNVKTLQRKIKTALGMGTPTFYIASASKYLIPIEINKIEASGFSHMRQDVSIIPFDVEKKLVALIITDQTIMTNTNNLLESKIEQIRELNLKLIAEKKIVNERVIYIKFNNRFEITDCSKAYLNLVDSQKDQIVMCNFFEYENLTIENELQDNIIHHVNKKEIYKYEKITLTSAGKELWLSNTLVPEYDQNNKHIGFVIFSDDITNSKLIQKHQRKLLENSRTAAMGEMISMIAHQWRQPLSVINTIIATLKIKKELDMLNETIVNDSYTKIEKTVKYLSETIDDFRNFFKKNKELSSVKVQKIIDKSSSLLKGDMSINDIKYIEEIEAITINTYQNELIQTIINILKNSVDAFKENPQMDQKITLKAYQNNKHIFIEIEDNAGGIEKEVLDKVYEPYFSTKSKNGTGLGLYVCKTIIEEHLHGKLTMSSNNKKTKTIIELPKILLTEENT